MKLKFFIVFIAFFIFNSQNAVAWNKSYSFSASLDSHQDATSCSYEIIKGQFALTFFEDKKVDFKINLSSLISRENGLEVYEQDHKVGLNIIRKRLEVYKDSTGIFKIRGEKLKRMFFSSETLESFECHF